MDHNNIFKTFAVLTGKSREHKIDFTMHFSIFDTPSFCKDKYDVFYYSRFMVFVYMGLGDVDKVEPIAIAETTGRGLNDIMDDCIVSCTVECERFSSDTNVFPGSRAERGDVSKTKFFEDALEAFGYVEL
ncbi:hypothetical protein ABNR98_004456 [Salmonella enterica]